MAASNASSPTLGLGPAARRGRRWRDGAHLRLARGIKGGARLVPDLADPGHAIAAAGGWGPRLGHHRDLLRGQRAGTPDSETLHAELADALRRGSRSFSAPSRAASAFSRHCSSL